MKDKILLTLVLLLSFSPFILGQLVFIRWAL